MKTPKLWLRKTLRCNKVINRCIFMHESFIWIYSICALSLSVSEASTTETCYSLFVVCARECVCVRACVLVHFSSILEFIFVYFILLICLISFSVSVFVCMSVCMSTNVRVLLVSCAHQHINQQAPNWRSCPTRMVE